MGPSLCNQPGHLQPPGCMPQSGPTRGLLGAYSGPAVEGVSGGASCPARASTARENACQRSARAPASSATRCSWLIGIDDTYAMQSASTRVPRNHSSNGVELTGGEGGPGAGSAGDDTGGDT